MNHEILVAGFGGQGVLSLGMTIAYAGMLEEKEVVWMPSYGPEIRGGTAHCTVIVSDHRISSPIISCFDTAIILNQPSMDKFESYVKSGGYIFYESNNVINPPNRSDISKVDVPAALEAAAMKNRQVMNMIVLGAFLELKPILSVKSVAQALKKVLPERRHNMIPVNEQAIERGMELVKHPVAG
ncbi:MAG: 2-oxoacid:acceptor oxidoreductase family protein [Candidatus Marinimicrobia bacterium]|jgi:2-oxoglutarate ferredoxin oxidoreductase subunit gamma|nr:2-oxoacid:acceptor oxidoreductase family protein [Candidatus Neomarinimicrobiota bacterium]|tara:strand:+ start:2202 stop:2753 length:552 start_codon:yes stop_codon:yes gene_type:complete